VQRFNPMLTQDIEIVLLRALGKQPADRFPKALDLSMALAKAIGVDIETTNRLDVAQLEELAKDMRQARADETPVKFDLASMVAADADSSSPTPVVKLAAPAIPAPRRPEAPADRPVEKAGPSTRQLSVAEVERQDKARQRAIRRAQRAAAPAPWYAVIPVMILLLLMWFSVGLFAGARVRIQVNQATLSVIHAVQTGEAATATQIGEATQVAAANATATQSIMDATATGAAVVPTDTPTPSPTPTATPSPTPTAVGGSLGRIALVSNRDGDNDIFLLDLNTGEFLKLTDNDVEDDAPSFSPDGQWIAYESLDNAQQRQHIHAMRADGSERRELTTGIRTDEYPIWSPEGTILFLSEEGNRFYLRSVTLEGVEIEILQLPIRVRPIEFTADGLSLLAFGRTPPDNHDELMNLELATGNRRRLTNQVGLIPFGDLSPDGSQIVFTWTLNNRKQVWLADTTCEFANRCNAQRLTDDFFNYETPRFSPDGTLILVTANRFNHRDLFILDLNGNTVRRVTESPFEEFNGVWEPAPATP
jgi:dipeptidyl aminopeptidase/acylaminoacyl peptidase